MALGETYNVKNRLFNSAVPDPWMKIFHQRLRTIQEANDTMVGR